MAIKRYETIAIFQTYGQRTEKEFLDTGNHRAVRLPEDSTSKKWILIEFEANSRSLKIRIEFPVLCVNRV